MDVHWHRLSRFSQHSSIQFQVFLNRTSLLLIETRRESGMQPSTQMQALKSGGRARVDLNWIVLWGLRWNLAHRPSPLFSFTRRPENTDTRINSDTEERKRKLVNSSVKHQKSFANEEPFGLAIKTPATEMKLFTMLLHSITSHKLNSEPRVLGDNGAQRARERWCEAHKIHSHRCFLDNSGTSIVKSIFVRSMSRRLAVSWIRVCDLVWSLALGCCQVRTEYARGRQSIESSDCDLIGWGTCDCWFVLVVNAST